MAKVAHDMSTHRIGGLHRRTAFCGAGMEWNHDAWIRHEYIIPSNMSRPGEAAAFSGIVPGVLHCIYIFIRCCNAIIFLNPCGDRCDLYRAQTIATSFGALLFHP